MASTLTVPMSTFVDRALLELRAPNEIGKTVVRAAPLATTDTTFVLTGYSNINVSDILEFGSELMLVTAKSADTDPLYTVSRGYYGTTVAAQASNQVGLVNPLYPRSRVAEGVRRSFVRLEALGVPRLVVTQITPTLSAETVGLYYLAISNSAREVWSVRDDLTELDSWEFVDNLPTGDYSTGKVVRLPRSADSTHDFTVVYRRPYRWSSHPNAPSETDTIEVAEGAEDLPSAYAAAWVVEAREVSRQELDRASEWTQGEPTRGGISLSLSRAKWQSFYRMLDEYRRIDPPLPRRPFIRKPYRGFYTV